VSARATAAPLAVGLIDIDNFKKLNDTLGHAAGDKALQSLAPRCANGFARSTTWRASAARSSWSCCRPPPAPKRSRR
jgi:diguanylate cyclase (GGDEF)-like protein